MDQTITRGNPNETWVMLRKSSSNIKPEVDYRHQYDMLLQPHILEANPPPHQTIWSPPFSFRCQQKTLQEMLSYISHGPGPYYIPFEGRHSFTDRTQSIHCLTSFGYGPRTPTLPQGRDHQYFPSLWKTLTLEQKHHLIDKLQAAFNAFNSWFTNRFVTMDNEGIPRSEQFYWLFPQKIEWNAPLIPT